MPQLNQNHFIFVEIFMCAQSPKVSGLKKKFNFKPPWVPLCIYVYELRKKRYLPFTRPWKYKLQLKVK